LNWSHRHLEPLRKLEQASFNRIAVQAGMTLQALVPDTQRLKLWHQNLTGPSRLVTGRESVTNGSVGVSVGRVQDLSIGVKKAEVSCAIAHTLNAKKHSELLVDVFADAIRSVEAKNDSLRGNAYLLGLENTGRRRRL